MVAAARGAMKCLAPLIVGVVLAGCSDDAPSVLDPAGPGARHAARLWWPMLWISVAVFFVVGVMLVVAVRRASNKDQELDRSHVKWGEPFIAIAGVFAPAVILAATFVFSLVEMDRLASGGDDATLTIEVTGRNWWWRVRYPNGAVTANEIHIPAGEPVRLELVAADVLHSFWVPELQVKTDMVPGTTNSMWIEADRPGRYRGQCAEFCGLQHANMIFYVIAEPPDRFNEWLENEAEPADPPAGTSAQQGEAIFLNSSCAGCHAVRGTDAAAQLGPDLTHFALRETLGAGVAANTPANLASFIRDAQTMKPGASMPPAELGSHDIQVLLDYLEQLD